MFIHLNMRGHKMTEPKRYFTIRNRDTDKALGLGGPMDRDRALTLIKSRRRGDDGKPFAPSQWMVTAWYGTGGDDDQIEFQLSADEFSATNGLGVL